MELDRTKDLFPISITMLFVYLASCTFKLVTTAWLQFATRQAVPAAILEFSHQSW